MYIYIYTHIIYQGQVSVYSLYSYHLYECICMINVYIIWL